MSGNDDWDCQPDFEERHEYRKPKGRRKPVPIRQESHSGPQEYQGWKIYPIGRVYYGIKKGERIITGFLSVDYAKEYIKRRL